MTRNHGFLFVCFFSGKARRGDGNDLTANPKKLAAIGKELDQLSKVINDLTPVSEMPFGARCKSRKEKNKLVIIIEKQMNLKKHFFGLKCVKKKFFFKIHRPPELADSKRKPSMKPTS